MDLPSWWIQVLWPATEVRSVAVRAGWQWPEAVQLTELFATSATRRDSSEALQAVAEGLEVHRLQPAQANAAQDLPLKAQVVQHGGTRQIPNTASDVGAGVG